MTQCLLNPRFTGPMVSSPMRLSPRIAARRWTELGVRGRLSGLKIDSRMAPSPGTPHPRVLISRPTTGAVREEEATTQQMTHRAFGGACVEGDAAGMRRKADLTAALVELSVVATARSSRACRRRQHLPSGRAERR